MAFVKQVLDKARERLVTIEVGEELILAARLLRSGTDMIAACDEAGVLRGIVTKTDVIARLSENGSLHQSMPVAGVMQEAVLTCGPDDDLETVWLEMRAREFKNVPVIDGKGYPTGILNARDALGVLLRESEDEETMLRDYVMGVGYR